MYDPSIGRFLTEDPLGFRSGDINLYRYVRNSPLNATDPSGLIGRTVQLGGGEAQAYVEWLPEQGVAEISVSRGGNELTRFRWLRTDPGRVIEVRTHRDGNVQLPGISPNLMRRISLSLTYQIRNMIMRTQLGVPNFSWNRNLIPNAVRQAYPQCPPANRPGGGRMGRGAALGLAAFSVFGLGASSYIENRGHADIAPGAADRFRRIEQWESFGFSPEIARTFPLEVSPDVYQAHVTIEMRPETINNLLSRTPALSRQQWEQIFEGFFVYHLSLPDSDRIDVIIDNWSRIMNRFDTTERMLAPNDA
jgi:hypothetical protein